MTFENIINFFEKGKGPWDIGSEEKKEEGSKEEEKSDKKAEDIISKLFGKKSKKRGGGNGGGNGNKSSKNKFDFPFTKNPKFFILAIIFGFLAIWLSSGIYKINPDENGVVLYFGRFHSITNSGLNFYIPLPIGKLQKVSVTRINKEEFGFDSGISSKRNKYKFVRNFDEESLMLTGDENIADIDFEVQWKVGNVKEYLFNIANPKSTIRKATESAMREIIAKRPIDDALANKKSEIEREVKNLVQEILNSYKSGVEIVLVQMLRVDPPKEVISAFRDVQTAKADKERKINEAEAYNNDVIPRARGEAEKIIQEAEAYKQSMIANAEGQASRFNNVYREYRRAKFVTKKRMYLETMEEIYGNTNKIIIGEEIGKGVVPYLPLENINK
jgi:membrane protease subunit HflK